MAMGLSARCNAHLFRFAAYMEVTGDSPHIRFHMYWPPSKLPLRLALSSRCTSSPGRSSLDPNPRLRLRQRSGSWQRRPGAPQAWVAHLPTFRVSGSPHQSPSLQSPPDQASGQYQPLQAPAWGANWPVQTGPRREVNVSGVAAVRKVHNRERVCRFRKRYERLGRSVSCGQSPSSVAYPLRCPVHQCPCPLATFRNQLVFESGIGTACESVGG